MAYTTIDNPELYFQTKLYTGTGSSHAITFDGDEDMQPDWVWTKKRSNTGGHIINDSVRGSGKHLFTNLTNAEATYDQFLTSFDSDGFTVGNDAEINQSSQTYAGWCWKAGGSASSNSDGTITSSVSASTDAGFSIVAYTGTGSQATVGHGLGVAPSVLIHKKRTTSAEAWSVFHQSVGITKRMILSSTEAETADASPQPDWNDVLPTSSVFTIGTSSRTNASENYICYAFAEKKGYSMFSSYIGNDNADGTFVYTSFAPAWVMIKRINSTNNWIILDRKRNPVNPSNERIFADQNTASSTANIMVDFLSNGFKARSTYGGINGSGDEFIFFAFAESPFVNSKSVPNNAI